MSGKLLTLERFCYAPGKGTFGRLTIDGTDFSCFTVEQDWEDNKPFVSCIPEGLYKLRYGRFNAGGYNTYEFVHVPGRTHIKFHRGNTLHDLKGCIAPGKTLGTIHDDWAVLNSTGAFSEFMAAMEQSPEAVIYIRSVFGREGIK